jgi:ankyrin repeat protein
MRTATLLLPLALLAAACNGLPGTPLIQAARQGDTAAIRALVARGASPNETGGVNGWTALEHAIHKNQLASVDALLAAGADPNIADPQGTTPVIMAAGYGYKPIVELLLRHGANAHLINHDGQNALDAAISGTTDIDRFTLFDCQSSTVTALQTADPTLSAHASAQVARWAKKCG